MRFSNPFRRSRPIWVAAALSAAAIGVAGHAAITVDRTLVAETPEAFEKGVAYPLVGLYGAAPTYVSARVYKWSQRGSDMYVLEPTDDFTVFPELVRVGSDTRRKVTIKANHPLPRDREGDYRIILREFDRADGTDVVSDEEKTGAAIRVKPQASMPMIVRAPGDARPAPMTIEGVSDAPPPSAVERAGGARPHQLLRLRNPGATYQRIVAIGVNQAAGVTNQMVGYVLPGQTVDLPMVLKRGDRIEIVYANGPDAKVDIRSDRATDDRQRLTWTVQ